MDDTERLAKIAELLAAELEMAIEQEHWEALPELPELPELIRPCGTCNGTGVTYAPEWRAWWERRNAARAAWEAVNPGGDWFRSAMCSEVEADLPEGPEEPECPACRGKGEVPTEAGEKILTFLTRMALDQGR